MDKQTAFYAVTDMLLEPENQTFLKEEVDKALQVILATAWSFEQVKIAHSGGGVAELQTAKAKYQTLGLKV